MNGMFENRTPYPANKEKRVKTIVKLWVGLMILAALSPLGLILPAYFKSPAAWGEWGPQELRAAVGYIPQGLVRLSCLWSAPIPDYAFKGWEEKGLLSLGFAYIISAVAGIAVVAVVIFIISMFLKKKD